MTGLVPERLDTAAQPKAGSLHPINTAVTARQ